MNVPKRTADMAPESMAQVMDVNALVPMQKGSPVHGRENED